MPMTSDAESPELALLSALEVRRLVVAREVSPREVAAACLERIRRIDDQVRSFVTIDEDMVMAMAGDVERRLKEGADLPLAGIPYAIKDLTDTAGLRTTYGSRLREHNVPDRDAAVARRLREAGGVLLGKTNTPEFGNRATTAYGLFPATRNPWNLSRTAGGSSGGSAAAVAACLCPIAEGSDGGGSIRIPSSCCGVVGIKPSRGRVSNHPDANPRGGLITHGPIARTVSDASLMLDVMAGAEPGDPFLAPEQTLSFRDERAGPERPAHRPARHQRQVDRPAGRRRSPHGRRAAGVPGTSRGTGPGRPHGPWPGVPGDGRGRECRQRRRRPRAVQRPLFALVL
jgi:Asp-tRNA(Asn)/Glu-tRNA(Gln) amidotransferase A subunit family amidase